MINTIRALALLLILCFRRQHAQATPIVGGEMVKADNENQRPYPYMVSLQNVIIRNNSTEYRHFCGGTLIEHSWILTAAHCVWRKNLQLVVAVIGHADISHVREQERYPIDHVEYIYFRPTNYQNDIALLRLKSEAAHPLDELQPTDSIFGALPYGAIKANTEKPCKIIGYGATHYAGIAQTNLYEAQVHMISNERCQQILGHVWAPQSGENTICALGSNQDTCQGDSGGPLICEHNGKSIVYGIVSHGPTCGIAGTPSIYTVTPPYYEWIQLVIGN